MKTINEKDFGKTSKGNWLQYIHWKMKQECRSAYLTSEQH